MAKRFGGKFSPNAQKTATVSAPTVSAPMRTRLRSTLLFLAPLPLVWQAFGHGPERMALVLVALGLLLLAAWLTRAGLAAQAAYDARKIARRPAIPRKIFGSVLTGLGLGLAGWAMGAGLLAAMIYTGAGLVLHGFAFGLDPLRDKGVKGIDLFQTDRVAKVAQTAQKHLSTMQEAVEKSGEREAIDQFNRFRGTVQTMLKTVEDDPRDLTSAKKYLGVYLMGARDASDKFADLYAQTKDTAARIQYVQLLKDLETSFTSKTQTLLQEDSVDLDIEIEVLRDRLEQDGIAISQP